MTTSLIIADLHLITNEVEKNQLFAKFCSEVAPKYDQLIILGDLFNTWIGDDISIDNYQDIVKSLKILSNTTKIKIIIGNRDFLIGKEFAKQTGSELINTPYLLETKSKDYLLTHGDELCTDDEDYQQLKSILQHPITKYIFLHLPRKLRIKNSGGLRNKSDEAQRYKTREIMDVNPDAVNKLMQKYPKADLIHGHTHKQNIHAGEKYNRYVLGDWSSNKGSAIAISDKLDYLEIS